MTSGELALQFLYQNMYEYEDIIFNKLPSLFFLVFIVMDCKHVDFVCSRIIRDLNYFDSVIKMFFFTFDSDFRSTNIVIFA